MASFLRNYSSFLVIFLINVFYYIDRYTIAAMLSQIQTFYNVNDSMGGLIQTIFLIGFIASSPLFGFLGDRMNRKIIVIVGTIIEIAAVIGCSFVPKNMFWLFLVCRVFVGVGQAAYWSVIPAMLSDMFSGTERARIFMIFYYGVPVGSGIGFAVGPAIAKALKHWYWGVRIPPFVTAGILIAAVVLLFDPERGGAEATAAPVEKKGNYFLDVLAVITTWTFSACTVATTGVLFVTGTISWWEPSIVEHSKAWHLELNSSKELTDTTSIGLTFGVITAVAGLIGVTVGTFAAMAVYQGIGCLHRIKTPRSKPLVCCFGAIVAAPIMAVCLIFGHHAILIIWVCIGAIVFLLALNWGLNVDIMMSVIVPWRRSTAMSCFLLVSHCIGDAGGPYIVGAVSDAIRGDVNDPKHQYLALVKGCAMLVPILVLSGICYFVCSLFIVRDLKKFDRELEAEADRSRTSTCPSCEDVDTLKAENRLPECDSIGSMRM